MTVCNTVSSQHGQGIVLGLRFNKTGRGEGLKERDKRNKDGGGEGRGRGRRGRKSREGGKDPKG